jgi:hypothetical protein
VGDQRNDQKQSRDTSVRPFVHGLKDSPSLVNMNTENLIRLHVYPLKFKRVEEIILDIDNKETIKGMDEMT